MKLPQARLRRAFFGLDNLAQFKLVGAVDGILQTQCALDVEYFIFYENVNQN